MARVETAAEHRSDGTEYQPIDHHKREVHVAGKGLEIDKLFEACVKKDGSDLHLKADSPPRIRIRGEIVNGKSPLTNDRIEALVFEIMDEDQRAYYLEHGSVDMAYDLAGSDRFRVNVFRQRGLTSVAARRVTRDIPPFEKLHLPPVIEQISNYHQGMVLLSGVTGSGKSTTIASMIDYISRRRACHIVTIEDPIEYLFEDHKAFINQREVGIDVKNFNEALKYLMREDPDVVLIGELRDQETFQAALRAAETGHLVFGTVHASTTPQTIGRVLDMFDEAERGLIRQTFAFNLLAVVSQRLLRSCDDTVGRVPAVEVMLVTPAVRKMIEEGRDTEILDVIKRGTGLGMQDFNYALRELVEAELVDHETAFAASPNPDELRMRLKGIVNR